MKSVGMGRLYEGERLVFVFVFYLYFIIQTQHNGPKVKLHVSTILKTAKGTSNSYTNI